MTDAPDPDVRSRTAPDPEPPPADTPAATLDAVTLIEGVGDAASAGDTTVVHYVGKLADGTVFDASWDRGQPFPVTLGQGRVISGWDQGLVGVRAGERRRLVLGADHGYGSRGAGGVIPPDAPLVFEVDVLEIHRG
jgi:FKBP-type peptidyl-prolyl cis-trans isomerase